MLFSVSSFATACDCSVIQARQILPPPQSLCSIERQKLLYNIICQLSMREETPAAHSWLPAFIRNSKSKNTSSGDSSLDERSSLIPKRSNTVPSGTDENGEIFDREDEEKSTSKNVLREFKILLKGSVPVILAYMLQNSLQTISVVIVGRGSPEDLATAAFSYMFAMCTAWLIALGGTTALDTLCSSTFTGSRNPHDLGLLLQRAFVVLGLFYIPVAILWFCAEPVFKALGQDDQLSRDSARFLWCLIPGGLGYIYFEAMKKYLQAQGSSRSFPPDLLLICLQRSCGQGLTSSSLPHLLTPPSTFSSSTLSKWVC